jgi:hypothetical protein
MSFFLLPHTLGEEIEKMMNSFWWDHNGNGTRGIHWLSWDRLSIHKHDADMGFKFMLLI